MLRRLYDWTMGLAAHRHAMPALACVSFIESSVFPIPPDVLLIPMVLANREKAFRIAFVCTAASVLGGFLGYAIGAFLFAEVGRPVLEFYGYAPKFAEFQAKYNEWGAWAVFIAGVTPFPYKVITILSGVTALDPLAFVVSSVAARGLRFFVVAALLWHFGEPIRDFIEKRLTMLFTLFCVLLVGGFVAAGFLFQGRHLTRAATGAMPLAAAAAFDYMESMIIENGRMDWPRLVPFGILAASVGALATAYTAELVYGIEPCILCLYQRAPYSAAGILALLALLLPRGRFRVWAVTTCGAVFAVGAGIAFYHVGVEQHWWASAAACGVGGGGAEPTTVEELRRMLTAKQPKACDEIDWTLFGVSMATYNVAASAALAVASFWGADRLRRSP